MAPSTSQSTVAKTSSDASVAKWSALSAGYNPIPENSACYRSFLEGMMANKGGETKSSFFQPKQSPLVNAGYAMRVASVAHAVHSFVSFHAAQCDRIDIILMGCGLDVLGLWAHSLAPQQVHIYEVDMLPVATSKRDKLLEQGFIIPDTNAEATNHAMKDQVILEGRIKTVSTDPSVVVEPTLSTSNNYHLVAADLCDLDSLARGFSQVSLLPRAQQNDINYPTLVLFELVLVYLGNEPMDRLLEWCASRLLGKAPSRSALVAFEALGGHHGLDPRPSSGIVQAYQLEYGRQFQTKLHRGKAQTENVSNGKNHAGCVFHPIATTCRQVEQRLQNLHGYTHVHACLAGSSAWWAARQQSTLQLTVPTGELFDEHAALTLHLSSYVHVTAFARADTEDHFLLRSRLCPWFYESFMKKTAIGNDNIYVAVLETQDESSVRDLFSSTYESLCDQYPAVKKMVKTALKKEFSTRSGGPHHGESTIRSGYQRSGGDFLVAVRYSAEKNGRREVIGAIGVREWKETSDMKKGSESRSTSSPTYEIHRFFVAEQWRSQGVGSSLLEMAETVVKSQLRQGAKNYRIVATTLSLLTGANYLYSNNGYSVLEKASTGDLEMKTFVKEFS